MPVRVWTKQDLTPSGHSLKGKEAGEDVDAEMGFEKAEIGAQEDEAASATLSPDSAAWTTVENTHWMHCIGKGV